MLFYPFHTGRNRGSVSLTNFPKVTQVAGGGAGFHVSHPDEQLRSLHLHCDPPTATSSMSQWAAKAPCGCPLASSLLSTASETDTGHIPSSGSVQNFSLGRWWCVQTSAVMRFCLPTLKLDGERQGLMNCVTENSTSQPMNSSSPQSRLHKSLFPTPRTWARPSL